MTDNNEDEFPFVPPAQAEPLQPPEVVDDPKKPVKAIVALITAVVIAGLQTALTVFGDGAWTTEDTLVVLLAVAGAIAVWAAPNPKIVADQ